MSMEQDVNVFLAKLGTTRVVQLVQQVRISLQAVTHALVVQLTVSVKWRVKFNVHALMDTTDLYKERRIWPVNVSSDGDVLYAWASSQSFVLTLT